MKTDEILIFIDKKRSIKLSRLYSQLYSRFVLITQRANKIGKTLRVEINITFNRINNTIEINVEKGFRSHGSLTSNM